jgi:EAL domain-containing protein (putative c-di-GMP-specific phosphodiesterase class I)
VTAALRVSVNLSTRQLQEQDLTEFISQVLDDAGIQPSQLELELTETAMMQDPENAITTLNQLDQLGVHIAIDDFGTSYSSLSYLKQFPIRTLKIDRSFVRDIGHDAHDEVIIKAISGLAEKLGLGVVAEAVETQEQGDFLLANGCNVMQDFLYAKPIPVEEREQVLSGSSTVEISSPVMPLLADIQQIRANSP